METWKDIPDYEGLYQASNLGRIKGLNRESYQKGRWGIAFVKFPEIILKQEVKKTGYHYIGLTKNGKRKGFLVHRLVLMAFFGKSKLQCNHKDGNKSNNNYDNLEYCTSKENLHHCMNVLKKKIGEKSGLAKIKESDAIRILKNNEPINLLANEFNMTYQAIWNIRNGKTWKHLSRS